MLLYRFPQAITLVIMNENSDLNIDNCQCGMTLIGGDSHWRLYQQALRLEHTAQQLLAFLIHLQVGMPTGAIALRCCSSKQVIPGTSAAVCLRPTALR